MRPEAQPASANNNPIVTMRRMIAPPPEFPLPVTLAKTPPFGSEKIRPHAACADRMTEPPAPFNQQRMKLPEAKRHSEKLSYFSIPLV
jgi:hypothetical protein